MIENIVIKTSISKNLSMVFSLRNISTIEIDVKKESPIHNELKEDVFL